MILRKRLCDREGQKDKKQPERLAMGQRNRGPRSEQLYDERLYRTLGRCETQLFHLPT